MPKRSLVPVGKTAKRRRVALPPPENGHSEMEPASTRRHNDDEIQPAPPSRNVRRRRTISIDFNDEEERNVRTQNSSQRRSRHANNLQPEAKDEPDVLPPNDDNDRNANGWHIGSQVEKEDPHFEPTQPSNEDIAGPENGIAEDANHEDGDGVHDEDDDDDDTNVPINEGIGGGFACTGILEHVILERFMNHEYFDYQLGPNVNIVNGANGSGKSAIVAALQIGLGARSGDTERGSKFADLIKHGEQSGAVIIKIMNRKPTDAVTADFTFKHSVYGDTITIERRLYRDKASTWAVKSKNRHVQLPAGKSANQEVTDIVHHFGFKVDNPVSILTQTKSKAFLARGKPSQHYALYEEATLLKPLEMELEKCRQLTDDVVRLLRTTESRRPAAEKQLGMLEAAHNDAQEMKTINQRIKEASILCSWLIVEENEAQLRQNTETTRTEFGPEEARALRSLQKQEKIMEELRVNQERLTAEVETLRAAADVLRDGYRKGLLDKKNIEHDVVRYKRKLDSTKKEAGDLDRTAENIERRRDEARQNHFRGQEQKSRLLESLEKLREDEKEAGESIDRLKQEDTEKQESLYPLSDERRKIEDASRSLEHEYENRRRQHTQLRSALNDSNRLARYGENIVKTKKIIENNKSRFNRVPIGPVGDYIKLRDDEEEWAPAVELAIGKQNLLSFIVHDSHDFHTLQGMLPRRGPRPPILVLNMARDRYTIRSTDIPDVHRLGHFTVLDILTIDHDIVFNALVDLCQIEQSVLINRDEEVTQLGWQRIENMKCAYNKNCERAFVRNGSSTYRQPPKRKGAQFITKDMRNVLASSEQELRGMDNDRRLYKDRLKAMDARMSELNRSVTDIRRAMEECRKTSAQALRSRQAIEDQLNTAENAFDSSRFDEELTEVENEKKRLANVMDQVQVEIDQAKARVVDMEDAIDDAKRKKTEAATKCREATENLDGTQNNVAAARQRLRGLKKEHERAENTLKQAYEELEIAKQALAESTASALNVGPRPSNIGEVNMTRQQADRKLQSLHARMAAEQSRRGGKTAEQIETEYLMAKKNDQANVQKLNRVRSYVTALTKGNERRRKKIYTLRVSTKKLVRAQFREFLRKRKHNGNIAFDTEKDPPELYIKTQMASHQRADGELYETTDVRKLSGGERSFTTLCFMLALAEVCQNPVRVMDEIDVFQDETNRRSSFKILIEFFNKYLSNRQVVIITPHSLPDIVPCPAVRIVKLQPPRDSTSSRGRQTRMDQFMSSEG